MVKKKFTSKPALEFFKKEEILKLLNQHAAGKKDNSRKIFTIYTFLTWYEIFMCK